VWIKNLAQTTNIAEERIRVLFERYGTRAADVATFIAASDDSPLKHHAQYSIREVMYIIENEFVTSASDLVLRRTLLAILGELSYELIEELAGILAEQHQ